MRRMNWTIALGAALVVLSAMLYLVHYAIFQDSHHIWIYLLGDIAFLPIEVLLVTIVIHQLLSAREKRAMLSKLNMVIGAFFSEVGTRLLGEFASLDPAAADKRERLAAAAGWSDRQFAELVRRFRDADNRPRFDAEGAVRLRSFLVERRGFLLGLLENPNLLEHELFTEMLWAVFHLTEELEQRADIAALPKTDRRHLEGDMKRAYGAILVQWLHYMQHLKKAYPYLFSLAIRMNPFDAEASPIVRE